MLLAEFDLLTAISNFGIAGFAVWVLWQSQRSQDETQRLQLKAFREELAIERTRGDAEMVAERQRHNAEMVAERARAEAHFLDERKIWTGLIGKTAGVVSSLEKKVSSLDSTVRQHLDLSKANNGHSDE